MKRFLITIILALTAAVSAAFGPVRGTVSDSTAVPASDLELIRGTYTYTYGDGESLVDARRTCKELAVRDAVESYYLIIESVSHVENSVLQKDLVRSVAAACVRNLRMTDEQEHGRTLTCTVEGEVNPDEVKQLIAVNVPADSSGVRPTGSEETVPDQPSGDGSLTRDPDSRRTDAAVRFAALLSRYENGTASAARDLGRARFEEALSKLKETDALLEAFPENAQGGFQLEMIRSMKLSNRLEAAVLRFEKSRPARAVRLRTSGRLEIRRAAEALERSIESLSRLDGLTDKQAAIRKAWALRCRGQLARSRSAIR
ncbi:hypothetical protein JW777_08755 [bacterium]|nr:hypothetical protein [bacterium]